MSQKPPATRIASVSNRTDEELMVLYQRGEIPQEQEEAFLELYRRHQSKIFGYLVTKLQSKGAAEDVFQLIWLRLHQARQSYDSSFPFLPWLFTISRNMAYDFLRRQSSALAHETLSEDLENLETQVELPTSPDVTSLSESPSLLESLPPKYRDPLRMRYLDEQSFEQMAKALKTSPSNARQRVSRALRFARAHLFNHGGKSS